MEKIGLNFLFILMLCASCQPDKSPLRLAVAANLLVPVTELEAAFEQETGIELEVTGAASGALTAQIQNGAPFHVFISANESFPRYLVDNGHAEPEPKVLVNGKLTVCTGVAVRNEAELIAYLRSESCQSIAVPNPEIAPYGIVAKNWLMEEALWEELRSKFVFGESVGKVNTMLYAQSVQAGFTSNSAMHTAKLRTLGEWVSLEWAPPVPQFALMLKRDHPGKKALWEFLFSQKAQEIFHTYGYTQPDQ
ncbi:MAG: molybdate ABC transporter substrate-binding protein [Bacteroidota bacterium]